ncbi:hypothetical protein FRAHR75_1170003 [Frankia sp. Hr75.2]|nr:hypothetical protein FRAHR75_1170003 [Frankia sp. Hr75.2]
MGGGGSPQGDHVGAVAVLREALRLWRGPALVDLPYGQAQAARLKELRLVAPEDLAEAELALPEGSSVAELRVLVSAHPLRERPRGQLMRALHASGRQAEALAEFEEIRRLLARRKRTLRRADVKKVRQLIESVNDTLKGQLDLEGHGGRTFEGVAVRVAQRLLAMAAAIWHNNQTAAPVTRPLIAYDH